MVFPIEAGEIEHLNACLVCEGREFERISTVLVGDLAFFSTDFCKSCGFVFRRTRPSVSWFDKSHKLWARNQKQWSFDEEHERRRYIRYRNLAQFLEAIVRGREIIDIGTGTGTGLKAFHDRSWIASGLEPEPVRATVGRENHGLNIIESTVEEYTRAEGSYDVATVIQTLEHFHSPFSCLQNVARLVREAGYIYIEVPDLMNYVDWNDSLHFSHMSNFTEETLVLLANRVGLKPRYRLFPKTRPHGVTHLGILFQKMNYEYSTNLNKQELANLYVKVKNLYAKGLPATPQGVIQISVPEVNQLGTIFNRTGKSVVYSESDRIFHFDRSPLALPPTLASRLIKIAKLPPKILARKIAEIIMSKLRPSKTKNIEDKDFHVLRFEEFS